MTICSHLRQNLFLAHSKHTKSESIREVDWQKGNDITLLSQTNTKSDSSHFSLLALIAAAAAATIENKNYTNKQALLLILSVSITNTCLVPVRTCLLDGVCLCVRMNALSDFNANFINICQLIKDNNLYSGE